MSNATHDDGSCYKDGCMEVWADNYDTLATTDDSTCYREGCMYETMLNFDSLATRDLQACTGETSFVSDAIQEALDSLANNHNAELDSLETAHSNQVTALEGDVASLEADVDSLSVLEGDLRIGLDSLYQVNGTQSDSIDTLNNRIEDSQILEISE